MQTTTTSRIEDLLHTSTPARIAEIVLVFAAALLVIAVGRPFVGDNPLAAQAVVWVANVVMITLIWVGLRLRGQSWAHLGLSVHAVGWRSVLGAFLKSLAVFVAAIAAFVLGAVIMSFVASGGGTQPPAADMSSYGYLRGNLPMLLLALAAVYVVSSLGEEIVYRGFLIERLSEIGGGTRAAVRWAVVVSAVVFGLVHFDWGLVGVVQTTFMGLALGISYLVVGRTLWVLVLAHAYMDTLLLVQLYLPAG